MKLSILEKEKIVASQNLAYTVCFSHDFSDFNTYTILDRPGMDYYILSSGHIVERNNADTVTKDLEIIEKYFDSVGKAAKISVLEDNKLPQEKLSDSGYKVSKDWDDNFYVFDANKLSKLSLKENIYKTVKVETENEYSNLRNTFNLKYFSADWLNNMGRAFNGNKIPYIHYFVAGGKTVIGASSLAIIESKGYLMSASVNENYRRKGIYTSMIIYRAKDCLDHKINHLVLNTAANNKETNSNAEKIGYLSKFKRRFYTKL